MERDQAIKVGVASFVLLVAVVLIAMNLKGRKPKVVDDAGASATVDESVQGGPRLAPGARE